jgi:hypothetical protein
MSYFITDISFPYSFPAWGKSRGQLSGANFLVRGGGEAEAGGGRCDSTSIK